MKKFSPLCVLALGAFLTLCFHACSNTKTYAEMLDDEKDAINDFINKNDIRVISQSEFLKDTVTDVGQNEYVQLASGVYMQIVDRGSSNPADTVKNNDQILVRFMEYNIADQDTTLTNIYYPEIVDVFRYTASSSSIAGLFTEGYMYSVHGTSVPAGWLVPFPYIRDRAHVKLIVPSKMGHSSAMSYVVPYFYDLTKIQIY